MNINAVTTTLYTTRGDMDVEEWKNELKVNMTFRGWVVSLENDEMISFEIPCVDGGRRWRDYYYDNRRFIDYNPDQKINLVRKKDPEND
jgi:hypothetical protein